MLCTGLNSYDFGCSGLYKHLGVVIVKKRLSYFMSEESFAPILLHAIQPISSKSW